MDDTKVVPRTGHPTQLNQMQDDVWNKTTLMACIAPSMVPYVNPSKSLQHVVLGCK